MGLGDKLIARLELQAETLAELRQLEEKRRARITELERKLGDAQGERDKLGADIDFLRQRLANAQQELSEQGQVHGVELQRETADLRQQLDLAQTEIETLRKQLAAAQRARTDRFQRAVEQLAELDAGTIQPAPVAEPDDDEDITEHAIDGDALAAGITEVVREIVEGRKAKAAAELQPTEPTPVAETLDAEGGA